MNRSLGALTGVALGDAMGMPSQTFSPAEIDAAYGWISDFMAPVDGHPVAHGMAAGSITDDTEQTLLLAIQILESPDRFDDESWARALLSWEKQVKSRGLHDLLGPSTKRALEAFSSGVSPLEAGLAGNTNGAAMRVVPVGLSTPAEPLCAFVEQIHATCKITHNTSAAIGAAAAVAAVVSAGVEGASFEETVPLALAAAREGSHRGQDDAAHIGERIEAALAIAGTVNAPTGLFELASQIGTSVLACESMATAFGIVRLAQGDPWRAAELGANIGGDTDTIGAIASGMAGGCAGMSGFPAQKVNTLMTVNNLDFEPIASGLLSVRAKRARPVTARG